MHLVNHNYDQGIQPCAGLTVSFDSPAAPSSVEWVTPDGAGGMLTSTTSGGRTTVQVPTLRYYDVLVVRW